jgi:hypothetical protein
VNYTVVREGLYRLTDHNHKALVRAYLMKPVYNDISASVRGLIFFGTPTRGSEKRNFWDSFASIFASSSQLIKSLETSRNTLFDEETETVFSQISSYVKITSFYETISTGSLGLVSGSFDDHGKATISNFSKI